MPVVGDSAPTLSKQIRTKPSRNCVPTWFHVRLGAGLWDVVKGTGGCVKSSPRKEVQGGIARSRQDLAILMVGGQACPSSSLLWA